MNVVDILTNAAKDGITVDLSAGGGLLVIPPSPETHWHSELFENRTAIVELLNGGGPNGDKHETILDNRNLTDMGNAERFAEQHGDQVRFVHKWAKWIVWDSRRWAIDDGGEVERLAKRTVRSIYQEAGKEGMGKEENKKTAQWAMASERVERLRAMLQLAKSEPPIPIKVASLDSEPWLLNCENGTLDLRTGELREHRQEDYLTKLAPVDYPNEPGVDADLWMMFLERIFDGDHELIEFVQRLIGTSLVGDVKEHILPIFHGRGANGKSVFLETISGLLGQNYAMKAPSSMLMANKSDRHPTELADLHGKRLVSVIETEDGRRLAESLVKELTGGDSVRARRMREDFWEFRPSHSVVMATNHRPIIRGTDYAIWRRLRLIPFNVVIPEAERDINLTDKLKAEWPAILRWSVEGCLKWQRHGLAAPDVVMAATNEYRADEDILGEFIAECCEADQIMETKASHLFRAYKSWSEARGERPISQTRFGKQLVERGFEKRHSNGIWYQGIGLVGRV